MRTFPAVVERNRPVRKLQIAVVDRKDDRSIDFWKNRSAEERLDAVEFLREQYYLLSGHKTIPRMGKTLRLTERPR